MPVEVILLMAGLGGVASFHTLMLWRILVSQEKTNALLEIIKDRTR